MKEYEIPKDIDTTVDEVWNVYFLKVPCNGVRKNSRRKKDDARRRRNEMSQRRIQLRNKKHSKKILRGKMLI